MTPETHILYHGDDLDGKGAAAIALRAIYPRASFASPALWLENAQRVCHPVTYGQSVPDLPPGCDVVLLDFSYPPPVMEALVKAHRLTHIDHYKPILDELRERKAFYESPALTLRWNSDGGVPSAIELASDFYGIGYRRIVRLLSEYDATPDENRSGTYWDENVLPCQHGMRTLPSDPWAAVWDDALGPDASDFLNETWLIGDAILRQQKLRDAENGPKSCYMAHFPYGEDDWKIALCGNAVSQGCFQHHPSYPVAQLLLSFRLEPQATGANRWKCTIWKGPQAGDDFDCGEFAKRYFKGGGHKGCAGFYLTTEHLPMP